MAAVTNITDDNDADDGDGRFDRGVDLVLKMEGQPGIDCTDERRRTELEQPPPLQPRKFCKLKFCKEEIQVSVFTEIHYPINTN